MGALKNAASLLARFLLCLALIACLWIVSISYRIGPFDYRGEFWVPNNSGAFATSDRLFLATALALLTCEVLRQVRRWWLANRADLLLYP